MPSDDSQTHLSAQHELAWSLLIDFDEYKWSQPAISRGEHILNSSLISGTRTQPKSDSQSIRHEWTVSDSLPRFASELAVSQTARLNIF